MSTDDVVTPVRQTSDSAVRRTPSSADVGPGRRSSIHGDKDAVIIDNPNPTVANARAMFLAKTAPKDEAKAKLAKRTSIAVLLLISWTAIFLNQSAGDDPSCPSRNDSLCTRSSSNNNK